VILDGYVLNVMSFLDDHPGGRFSLEHNIGRDVSKFFHGGYALENSSGMKPHTHSSDARQIVNKMIIGVVENPHASRIMVAEKVDRDANQVGNVKVIEF